MPQAIVAVQISLRVSLCSSYHKVLGGLRIFPPPSLFSPFHLVSTAWYLKAGLSESAKFSLVSRKGHKELRGEY